MAKASKRHAQRIGHRLNVANVGRQYLGVIGAEQYEISVPKPPAVLWTHKRVRMLLQLTQNTKSFSGFFTAVVRESTFGNAQVFSPFREP
jgi:hypothetical protein